MKRSESGVSEIISAVLAVILVIALAAIIGAIFLGWAVPLQKTPYIATQAAPVNITNASAVQLFMSQGEAVSLAPAMSSGLPVRFSLTNGSATYNFVPLPGAASAGWKPGTSLILFRNASGSWVAGSTAAVQNNIGFSNGTWTVNIIDANSNVLIAQHTVTLTGDSNESIPRYAPGILGNYFYDESWTQPAGTRVAPRIRFADNTTAYGSDEINWPTVVGRNDQFSVSFNGFLKVDTEDDYTFYLLSDDGSWLWIDGTQVINNGGLHGPTEVTGTRHLTPGYHTVRLPMFERTGQAVVHLRYKTPSMVVPGFVTNLWYEPAAGTPPVADFSASPLTGPPGTAVRFTDRSTGATAWLWDFGDGTPPSTTQNLIHTYSGSGSFTVSLTAKNPSGSDSETKAGYITIGPALANISATYYSDENWLTVAGSNTAPRIRFADTASGMASDMVNWPSPIIGKTDTFSVRYYGLLRVNNAGDYTFYLNSDDGSYLWVDGLLLVDNGGLHSPREYSGTTYLTTGYHMVEVKMFERTGGAVVWLQYSGPDQPVKGFVTDFWHL